MSKKDKKHKEDHQVEDQANETTQVEELSVEEQLKEELAKEKDKFIVYFQLVLLKYILIRKELLS